MENKNILILAPHTDDGELGCGATIKKISKDNSVYYIAFSICEKSVPKEFPKNILATEVKNATKKLDIPTENLIIRNYPVREFPNYRQPILEELVKVNKKIRPDIVFTPSSFDIHQDHKVIYEESIRAFKTTSILGYEFMWNNFSFSSTLFSVVNINHIKAKIDALNEYHSQKKKLYAKNNLIKGLANFRGLQISENYAEAFEVIRWIIS